jgi:hypothetical protein
LIASELILIELCSDFYSFGQYIFSLFLPFSRKMAVDLKKSSISSQILSLLKTKKKNYILFDFFDHGALTHVFLETVRIYLLFSVLATNSERAKKVLFVFFILPHVVFYFRMSDG